MFSQAVPCTNVVSHVLTELFNDFHALVSGYSYNHIGLSCFQDQQTSNSTAKSVYINLFNILNGRFCKIIKSFLQRR